MAFTTSGQETEWALFLQPRSPHGAVSWRLITCELEEHCAPLVCKPPAVAAAAAVLVLTV